MSETKEREQTVKGLGSSYHETLKAHIPFLRAEYHFNFPTVRIIFKNGFVIQRKVRAQKNAERIGVAKGFFGVGKQHDSVGNFIEGTLITMHPILTAFHRYKVKMTAKKRASVIHGGRSLPLEGLKDKPCK